MLAQCSVLVECVLEQEARYVAFGRIRHECHDRPYRRVSALSDLPRGGHRGSPAEAGGNSGVPGELPGGRSRLMLGDPKDFVNDLFSEIRTLEVGPQAVDLVR